MSETIVSHGKQKLSKQKKMSPFWMQNLLHIGDLILGGAEAEQWAAPLGVGTVEFGQRGGVVLFDGTAGLQVQSQVVQQFSVGAVLQRQTGALLGQRRLGGGHQGARLRGVMLVRRGGGGGGAVVGRRRAGALAAPARSLQIRGRSGRGRGGGGGGGGGHCRHDDQTMLS